MQQHQSILGYKGGRYLKLALLAGRSQSRTEE